MKKILLYILFVLSLGYCQAQQMALHSQFMVNDYVLNPAISGTKSFTPLTLSVRRQWVGIKEAPVTQFLSGHGYMGYNIGFGAMLYNEASGPTRRTGAAVSGAYHFILKKDQKNGQQVLSLGMSAMLSQLYLDKEKLITYLPDDPTIIAAYNTQMVPDANFGLYYHNENKYYFGLSVFNLIQTKTDLTNIPNDIKNNYVRNYYIMGGGDIEINNKLTMHPSMLIQGIEALPIQLDFNVRGIYLDKYWLGMSYRHKDAIVALLGYQYHEFTVAYSYDFTLSNIRNFSSGSHEIVLTMLLDKVGQNYYKTEPGTYKVKKGGRFRPVRMF